MEGNTSWQEEKEELLAAATVVVVAHLQFVACCVVCVLKGVYVWSVRSHHRRSTPGNSLAATSTRDATATQCSLLG